MSFVASARSTTPSWLDDKKTFREKAPFAATRWAALEHVEAAGRRDTTSTNVAEWSNEKMKSLLNWTKHKKKHSREVGEHVRKFAVDVMTSRNKILK